MKVYKLVDNLINLLDKVSYLVLKLKNDINATFFMGLFKSDAPRLGLGFKIRKFTSNLNHLKK